MPLLELLLAPALGPIMLVHWLGERLQEAEEQELYDEDRLRGELLDWQARYDLGEVTEEEYTRWETALVERMSAIREAKG